MNDKKILLGALMASCSCMMVMADVQNMTSSTTTTTSSTYSSSAQSTAEMPLHTLEGSNLYLAPAWQYLWSKDKATDTTYSGSMGGLSVGYDYVERDSLYFKAEFTYMAGALRHSGSNHVNTQEYITEVDFGYDISSPFGDKFTMTPFVGIGAYIFNQTLPNASHNFDSHFWYVPIGLSLEYRFDKSWMMSLVGYGAPTFSGHVHDSNMNGHACVSGLWSVELPISYIGSLPFEVALIPFSKGWAYKSHGSFDGDRQTYVGLKFAFGYHF